LRITDFCWFAVFTLRKADQRQRGDATPKNAWCIPRRASRKSFIFINSAPTAAKRSSDLQNAVVTPHPPNLDRHGNPFLIKHLQSIY